MGEDEKAPLRLVVLGDSLAFTDARGPQLPTEPTLYPNVLARLLEDALLRPVTLNVIARPGSDVREAWRAVFKDRHVQFEVLTGADAYVVGVGSFDHAPTGVPPILETLVPLIRPAAVRRRTRSLLRALQPWGLRLTGGRFTRTPATEFERLYDAIMLQVRALAHGAAGAALGPTSHRSAYYGNEHRQLADRERRHLTIAERHGIPMIPTWQLVEPYAELLNADGIHWPADAHRAIGEALAEVLIPQLTGAVSRPALPWS